MKMGSYTYSKILKKKINSMQNVQKQIQLSYFPTLASYINVTLQFRFCIKYLNLRMFYSHLPHRGCFTISVCRHLDQIKLSESP